MSFYNQGDRVALVCLPIVITKIIIFLLSVMPRVDMGVSKPVSLYVNASALLASI